MTLRCQLLHTFSLIFLLYSAQSLGNCKVIKVGGGDWLNVQELSNLRGSASGASISLLHKLPELIGVKISYEPATPFARQLQQLKEGQLDVLAGVYPTQERKKHYLFTDNYFYEKLFIFAKPEKIENLTTITQLKQSVGAVIRGASYGPILDELYSDKTKAIAAENQNQRLQLLLHDRVDYFIGTITAVGYSPQMKSIAIAEKPIYHQGVALGFSPKSECKHWIPKINQVIKSLF
jgi:polar amino acid transport system substrate-binding protein